MLYQGIVLHVPVGRMASSFSRGDASHSQSGSSRVWASPRGPGSMRTINPGSFHSAATSRSFELKLQPSGASLTPVQTIGSPRSLRAAIQNGGGPGRQRRAGSLEESRARIRAMLSSSSRHAANGSNSRSLCSDKRKICASETRALQSSAAT